jgi:chromosome segregation ATPase
MVIGLIYVIKHSVTELTINSKPIKFVTMENKQAYLDKNKIKVTSLLSEMYDNESRLLSKLEKKKNHLREIQEEIKELAEDYENQKNFRDDFTSKFKAIQEPSASNWEDFKSEYEMVLDFAEGDKGKFIQKAEAFMDELNGRISEMNEKMKDSADAAREKSQQMLDELKDRKESLQIRLDEAKEDTGEVWMEVKQWFIERAKSIKSILSG